MAWIDDLERAAMKSQLLLTLQLLDEYGKLVSTSTARDQETISRRTKDEGLSFLTITLPGFASDFHTCLERGWVANDVFQSFKKSSKHGRLPAFLRGFVSLVFDPTSGVLLDDPSIEAIDAVRQITMLHGKLLVPCTPERVSSAFQDYIECEEHVQLFDERRPLELERAFLQAATVIFGSVFAQLDEEIYYLADELRPKHGPGSTADRRVGNQKWLPTTWTSRLESVFPARDYLIPSERWYSELRHLDVLEPGAEPPVKVISVPKTLKTPRIIAMEPAHMQYAQQALSQRFVDLLETDKVTRMLVGFTDQMPNRRLAKLGSEGGSLATLDLSSASDLVSNRLVNVLFTHWPHLREAVAATRSRRASVLGHGVIPLSKFASMGSALCFPIEAVVFTTAVFVGIARELNTSVTQELVQMVLGRVRVYGDDIIVPVEYVHSVIDSLEAFGFKVGLGKSFWNGRFRESCGGDYYAGWDVTPVRCRRPIPTSREDAEGVISLVSLRNLLYGKGLWRTAGWLDEKITKLLGGLFPIVEPTSSVLGRHSVCFDYEAQRIEVNTHSPLVRGYVAHSKPPRNAVDDVPALLKFFLTRGEEPLQEGHLERSGRPRSVNIKARWTLPY